jgi:ABC-type transport system involved in cytochrome c biogenesis permease subunit
MTTWIYIEGLAIGLLTVFLFFIVEKYERHFPYATLLKIAILVVGGVTIIHIFILLLGME